MGITEDIRWLEAGKNSTMAIFLIVAKEGPCSLRQIKERYDRGGDWWPVKSYVRMLEERKLVEGKGGEYALTDYGKKILETMKATEGLAPL